jgi:transposase IS116/IS110/IS902 family protein
LRRRSTPSSFNQAAFAAYLGLTPKDHSSGGKQRLGGISRAGDERLRELLVLGAMSVLSHAVRGKPARGASAWLMKLPERKPRKVVAVALANKMARIAWAICRAARPIVGQRALRWPDPARHAGVQRRTQMMIGRSDSQQNAGFLRGASTSTGRLAAGCGSHLGPAVADRMQRPDTRLLSTHIIRLHLLHPRGRPHMEKRRSTE